MKVSLNYMYNLSYEERGWHVEKSYLYARIRYKVSGSLIANSTSLILLHDANRELLEEWINEGNMDKIDAWVINRIKGELSTNFKSQNDIEFINSAIKKHNKKSSKWKKTTFEL